MIFMNLEEELVITTATSKEEEEEKNMEKMNENLSPDPTVFAEQQSKYYYVVYFS